jgi:Putative prokaryotic signal transducing protein
MADWMIVYETSNEPEAHVVAGRLQVEGIQAVVYRQPGAAALGITIGMLGSITVLVRPPDYERSLVLLEPDDLDELPDTTDDITYIGIEEDDDPDELTD